MQTLKSVKITWMYFVLLMFSTTARADNTVVDGKIYLELANILQKPAKLNGQWRLSFAGRTKLEKVPSSWTYGELPPYGLGIYELDINFDKAPGELVLLTEYVATQYRVFADGVKVYGPESFETDPQKVRVSASNFVVLPVQGRQLNLKIEVSNHVDILGGLVRPIMLGNAQGIAQLLSKRKYEFTILTSVYVFLFFCFAYFGFRFADRRKSIHLALLCLSLLISFGLSLYLSFNFSGLWLNYIRLNDLGWIGFSYFFSICCVSTFDIGLPKWFTGFVQRIPFLALGISLFFQLQLRRELLLIVYAYSWITIFTVIVYATKAYRMKLKGSSLFLTTLVMLTIATANDSLNSLGLIDSEYVIGYFFIVYLLAQAWLLAEQQHARVVQLEKRQFQNLEQALSQKISGVVGHHELTQDGNFLETSCGHDRSAQGFWVQTHEHGRLWFFFLARIVGEPSSTMLTQIVTSYSMSGTLDAIAENTKENPSLWLERCAQAANKAVHQLAQVLGKSVIMSFNCVDLSRGTLHYMQAGDMCLMRLRSETWTRLENKHEYLGRSEITGYKAQTVKIEPGDRFFVHINDERTSILQESFIRVSWNKAI